VNQLSSRDVTADERIRKLEEGLGALLHRAVAIVVASGVSASASAGLLALPRPLAEQVMAAEAVDRPAGRESDASFAQSDSAPRRRLTRVRKWGSKWRSWLFYGGGCAVAAGLMAPEALAVGGAAAILAGLGGTVVGVVGGTAATQAWSRGSERA
jgi:hypothetical protein